MQRRDFLKGTAAFGAAAALGADEPRREPLRVVDTHVHLWDLNRLRLPWIQRDSPLNRSFVIRDYRAAIEGQNVVKALYMEVDVAPNQLVAEAEHVLGLCRQGGSPLVGAVIGGRPDAEDFAQYLRRFRGNRYLKGVRRVLHNAATPAGYCLRPAFVRGVRLLGEMGLRFDLCMRPADLGDAVRLVESCRDVSFILDHCGNGPVYAEDRRQWQRDMDRLGRLRNVVCKVSGIAVQLRPRWRAEDLAPVVNHTLRAFGPERVMFAGDWPVCTTRATFRQWLDTLKTIVRERPADEQRRLFHDNAVRVYGLA